MPAFALILVIGVLVAIVIYLVFGSKAGEKKSPIDGMPIDEDLDKIINGEDVDKVKLAKDLKQALEDLKRTADDKPLSPEAFLGSHWH